MTTTTTLPDVPLVKVGNWNASMGDGQVTAADIASMVAAYKNKAVDRIPIKLGHDDLRFQDAGGNPPMSGDGHPAYGWVENVRATPDGKTLLGDLVGIPSKLAEVIPAAFRNRSVEMQKGRRVAGTVYRAILSGLALLGVTPPGEGPRRHSRLVLRADGQPERSSGVRFHG